jgi:hypothetical protein
MRRTKQRLFPGAGGSQSPLASLFLQPKELRVMGYRSDVWIAMLVESEDDAMKLLSRYGQAERTKNCQLLEYWSITRENRVDPNLKNGTVLFYFEGHDWKWYDSYEEVMGIRNIVDHAKALEIPYAYREVVFGEEIEDLRDYIDYSHDQSDLCDLIFDVFTVARFCDKKRTHGEPVPAIDTYKLFVA